MHLFRVLCHLRHFPTFISVGAFSCQDSVQWGHALQQWTGSDVRTRKVLRRGVESRTLPPRQVMTNGHILKISYSVTPQYFDSIFRFSKTLQCYLAEISLGNNLYIPDLNIYEYVQYLFDISVAHLVHSYLVHFQQAVWNKMIKCSVTLSQPSSGFSEQTSVQ